VIREKEVCQLLPESLRSSHPAWLSLGWKLRALQPSSEKKRFESALLKANGDRNRAAEILGFSRATFFRKKDLGLVKVRRALKSLGLVTWDSGFI